MVSMVVHVLAIDHVKPIIYVDPQKSASQKAKYNGDFES